MAYTHSSGSFSGYDDSYQYSRIGTPGTGVGAVLSRAAGSLSSAASKLSSGIKSLVGSAKSILNGSSSSSGGAGGVVSPIGTVAPSTSVFETSNGKVDFKDSELSKAMQLIQQTAKENNAWSAEQAQKQMDFQLMMSNTAHQREIEDLKAAGLNPVLSAGGPGASTASGAMGQTDDSNTRLIADLAMVALESIGNTAVGVAGAAGGSSSSVPYMLRRFANSFSSSAGSAAARGLLKAIFKI